MGQSASAIREDHRADWIRKLTGAAVGADWAPHVADGTLPTVPIRVLLVRDLEHKYRLANRLTENKRAIVFCEAIADGRALQRRYGMPFIFSETAEPLAVIAANPRVAMSRVGDAGIDVPDLEVVVDLSFLGGSRAQSLQRFGRLLHSTRREEHIILMTDVEYQKRVKRIEILETKGFACRVERAPEIPDEGIARSGGDPANDWLLLLGHRRAA
jgi:DNA excision repair protein ERCC-3